jgi:hypothetical protein
LVITPKKDDPAAADLTVNKDEGEFNFDTPRLKMKRTLTKASKE